MRNCHFSLFILVCLWFAAPTLADDITSDTRWNVTPTVTQPLALDSAAPFRVDSVEYYQKNVFDDVVVLTPADQFAYHVLNKLHLKTRKSVVAKLILFHVGDTVTLRQLIESERQLRAQKIFADASIRLRIEPNGMHILRVVTSDNWTTTIPLSLTRPDGSKWLYQVGVLESNLLGLGQSVGVYYAKEELRDEYLLRYGDPHFFYPNNKFTVEYAKTTDGYATDFFLGKPFLSKSHDEWAYTIEGMSQSLDQYYYGSQKTLPKTQNLDSTQRSKLDSSAIPTYQPGAQPNLLFVLPSVREDSLSVRIGRSFGDDIKTMARVTYDYHNLVLGRVPPTRFVFVENSRYWVVDSATASDFLEQRGDSRLGLLVSIEHVSYTRLHNFHHIKWTEDVDNGWAITGQVTRNLPELGAKDDRWFCDGTVSVATALGINHFALTSYLESYLSDTGRTVQDFYGRLNGEYMFKPSNTFSTVLTGQIDQWHNAPLGNQLSLGAMQGLDGLPSSLLVGQARYLAGLEQRWFPGWEFGTVLPVFTAFMNAGQTYDRLQDFDPHTMEVLVGVGMRFGMSKSVNGIVNHLNYSWPVHGSYKESRFSLIATISL